MKKIGFKFGFTLIELLIVVAIIAILAAIAVPNFLEAQVRSKISRAKADIRTVTLGLETYKLDSGKYPPSKMNPLTERMRRLTTPVAYITSMMVDVFNPGKDGCSAFSGTAENWGGQGYIAPLNVLTIGTIENEYDTGSPFFNKVLLCFYAKQLGVNPENLKWVVFSYGPMQNPLDFPTYAAHSRTIDGMAISVTGYLDDIYDPSNGTISNGIISRVGP